MIAEGKHVYLYGDRDEAAPLVIINTFQGNGSSIYSALCSMTDKKVNLAVISDINWDNEMSPWECPPLSKNDIPCTGGADEYLVNLTRYISLLEIKRHEQEITCLARLKIKLKRLMSITKTAV